MAPAESAAAAAAQFAVESSDGQPTRLRPVDGSNYSHPLERTGVLMTVSASLVCVDWDSSGAALSTSSRHVAQFKIDRVVIGGNDKSRLVNDCVFGVDGDVIRSLVLSDFSVLSFPVFLDHVDAIEKIRGTDEAPLPEHRRDKEGAGVLKYLPEVARDPRSPGATMIIGLPEPAFDQIVEQGLAGRPVSISLGLIARALTTARRHEMPGDLILEAKRSAEVTITHSALRFDLLSGAQLRAQVADHESKLKAEVEAGNAGAAVLAASRLTNELLVKLTSTVKVAAWGVAAVIVLMAIVS